MADDTGGFVPYVAPGDAPPIPGQPEGDHGFVPYVAPGETEAANVPPHKPFTLMDTWPVRLAKTVWGAVTLPGDVYAGQRPSLTRDILAGETTPTVEDVTGRAADLASIANPTENLSALAKTAPTSAAADTSALRAAQTAADLGKPLPRGVASPNPAVQALTQGARELPLVGPKIGERAGETVTAAGERTSEFAKQLAGGTVERSEVGAQLRPAVEGVIARNKSSIDQAYNGMRNMVDVERPYPAPKTVQTLDKIMSERSGAGDLNSFAGLEDVTNLATRPEGASFNNLQRARTTLGHAIQWGKTNPGYNVGDLKRLYGALSQDMENVVRQNAPLKGFSAEDAAAALQSAHATAAPLIEDSARVSQLLNIKSDEGLVGALTRMTNAKTGNAQQLAKLRSTMDPDDFNKIAGVALHELGARPSAPGEFSLSQFATEWRKMSPQAKGILFSPEHRGFIDDLANLGNHLKDVEKFMNTSKTAGAGNTTKFLTALGSLGAALWAGGPVLAGTVAGGAAIGYVVANALAKPSSAASLARWARAVNDYTRLPSAAKAAAIRLGERNVFNNVPELRDMNARMEITREGYPYIQASKKDQTNLKLTTVPQQ